MARTKLKHEDGNTVTSTVSVGAFADDLKKRGTKAARAPKQPVVAEKVVKAKVRDVLKSLGIWYCTPIGSGYGPAAHDFVCCVPTPTGGKFLSIETKATNGKMRQRQFETVRAVNAAGGVCLIVFPGDITYMRNFIQDMINGNTPIQGA